jgi:hypothetical protein
VLPSKNFTVPAAVLGVTVALRVTTVPEATGLAGVTSRAVVVVVAGEVTVKLDVLDVDWVYAVASVGVNFAESECTPPVIAEVVSDAVPPDTATALPKAEAPSKNWTDPAAAEGVNVALSVTDVPSATGLAGVTLSAVVVVVASELIV